MTAVRINCPECGGSGVRMGTYGDLTCFDCSGEGSWEESETCVVCHAELHDGVCPKCDDYTAQVEREILFTMELQKRKAKAA